MSKPEPRQVGLGFVGGGYVGQVAHLSNYALLSSCKMVGICEARPRLRAAIKTHYGFKKSYATPRDLIDDSEVEAIVCITRRPNTGPLALQILEGGKHLLTEKPMAHTVAQAQRLVDQAEKNKLIYAVGYMRRHDVGIQAAKTLLDRLQSSGELGRLLSVRVHCLGGDSYCGAKAQVTTEEPYPTGLAEWALAPEWIPPAKIQAYASFCNVYSHDLNLLRYFFPKTPLVESTNLENPMKGLVVLDYGSFRANLEVGQGHSTGWDESLEFKFEKGGVRVELPAAFLAGATAKVELLGSATTTALPPAKPEWPFLRQARAFVANLAEGTRPLASATDALKDLNLIEQIWRAEIR